MEAGSYVAAGHSAIPYDYSSSPGGQDAAGDDAYKAVSHAGADVDMSAEISPQDLEVAGGLGARDDLASPLPAAMDATDFEEAISPLGAPEEDEAGNKDFSSNSHAAHPGLGATPESSSFAGDAAGSALWRQSPL
eukprot:SM000002S05587  [mRNA]  locus=s2:1009155:1010192:+ [translate_table: standard]